MRSPVSFQTRARTIDHLGREQIADCPTAISELWKNAYDAYARKVELHLFDGDIPVAALLDDVVFFILGILFFKLCMLVLKLSIGRLDYLVILFSFPQLYFRLLK